MNVVADASVFVAALVDAGPDGSWAEEVLGSCSIHAPAIIRVEVTNVLRRLERTHALSKAEAHAAFEDLMQYDTEELGFEPFAERIWELRQALSSYDAWYVSVAEALELPLATLDRRLARANGTSCRFLTPASRFKA